MVKIRLRTTLAGPQMTAIAGSVITVEDAFAKKLIDGGYAEPVENEAKAARAKVEKAVLKAPERALGVADDREEGEL